MDEMAHLRRALPRFQMHLLIYVIIMKKIDKMLPGLNDLFIVIIHQFSIKLMYVLYTRMG